MIFAPSSCASPRNSACDSRAGEQQATSSSMRTRAGIICVISVLLALSHFGCADDLAPVGNNPQLATSSPADWTSIQNPDNPFNEVGVIPC